MYINGEKVKELRESIGMTRSELAEYLALDTLQLRKYEENIEEWLEDDAFRLITLEELLPEVDFLLDVEYLEMLNELAEEYN